MIASSMILTGSLLILGLAGYWMRRAAKAEARVDALQSDTIATVEFYERFAADAKANAEARETILRIMVQGARSKLDRIISLETKSMAHVGKVAVAIARGLK